MLNKDGEYADMVDKIYVSAPSVKEIKIVDFKRVVKIHPYETANVKLLRNLFSFFAAIARCSSPSLMFNLITPCRVPTST